MTILWLCVLAMVTVAVIVIWIVYGHKVWSGEGFQSKQPLESVPYYRVVESGDTSAPSLDLNQAMTEAGQEFGVVKALHYDDAMLVAFESLNDIDRHIERISKADGLPRNARLVIGIRGTDQLASKSLLVMELRKMLGFEAASRIIPESYVLTDRAGARALIEAVKKTPDDVFICKKNVQRQQGVAILTGKDVAKHLAAHQDDDVPYVVCQRVLQNPLLVGKRKINLRVYMLVVLSEKGEAEFMVYPNGFLYYTPKHFEPMTTDPGHVITTGYIDRRVYQENPLTLSDLRKHMGDATYNVMWSNIKNALGQVKRAYSQTLRQANTELSGCVVQFMVYGVDIAPAADLSIKIMEINKGPDMSYKDDRDKAVKYNLASDVYRVVLNLQPHDFEQI